jgi:hypothetical protein
MAKRKVKGRKKERKEEDQQSQSRIEGRELEESQKFQY